MAKFQKQKSTGDTMKPTISQPYLWNDADDYADVAQYVVMPDKSEWKFPTSLCKETGEIYEGEAEFAADQEDGFDVAEDDPPAEATALYRENKHLAVAILEKCK